MAGPADYIIAVSWFVNIGLDIGAAWYCYKMTKITGGFRAWWLLIGFTILFAVQSFFSISYSVISAGVQQTSTVAPSVTGVAYFDVALGFILSVLLFTSMRGLHGTFKGASK